MGLKSLSNANAEPSRLGRRGSVISSNVNEYSFATGSDYFDILDEGFPIDNAEIKQFLKETKKRECILIGEGSFSGDFDTKVQNLLINDNGEDVNGRGDWMRLYNKLERMKKKETKLEK